MGCLDLGPAALRRGRCQGVRSGIRRGQGGGTFRPPAPCGPPDRRDGGGQRPAPVHEEPGGLQRAGGAGHGGRGVSGTPGLGARPGCHARRSGEPTVRVRRPALRRRRLPAHSRGPFRRWPPGQPAPRTRSEALASSTCPDPSWTSNAPQRPSPAH